MPNGIEGDLNDIQEFSERLKNCAVTIDILKYLNGLAIDLDYNRQIEPSFLDEKLEGKFNLVADDRFPAVLLMAMPHYHKQGVETETHVRMFFEVIVKTRDGSKLDKEYTQVTVDVPLETIEILPNIPEVRWIDSKISRSDWRESWDKVNKEGMTEAFINEIENLLKREGEDDE